MIGSIGPDELRCSRSGCHAAAVWNVNWRNPTIHSADRVKVWLSCDEHRDFFDGYFESRGFPVVVTPLGVTVEKVEAQ
jgi:hypothetical protein